ncbi:MAG TPA: H-NS histone family protein [Burkholderiaceae bacterium]|nr:H-NS histone family protein [Burkholderiaceae bacterium]
MSKYLELKQQIEALNAQLEETRAAEFDEQVADIKARIDAFGIKPEQLYSKDELSEPAPKPKRVRLPAKYALNGHTWSGKGNPPAWYREAVRNGKRPDEMLIA